MDGTIMGQKRLGWDWDATFKNGMGWDAFLSVFKSYFLKHI